MKGVISMREYTVRRRPASFSWEQIPPLYIDSLLWSEPVPIRCQARLCYDTDALYIRMEAVEPNIRAEETGPLGTPCLDSCLEFFFCPDPEDDLFRNSLPFPESPSGPTAINAAI